MSGGSRVSIPNNVRKTIQDIKEITGKHSDEDIYSMLKECNMDPNETVQRLWYLDTFHEVKRKRDRRKVNVSRSASEESRWTTGMQQQGARGGQGNDSPYAGNGRNVSARKENGVNSHTERGFRPSLPVPQKTENNATPPVTNSLNISVNGPLSVSNGSSSHGRAPQLSSGVYSSASDPVLVPSLNSRIPGVGTIKCEVGSQRIAAESSAKSSTAHDVANNLQAASRIANSTNRARTSKPQRVEKSQHSESSQASPLQSHDGSLPVVSNQDVQSPQQLIGTSKVVASEAATVAVEVSSQSLPELNASVLEEATSELDMKLVKLNISAHQPVIFPHHLQVPEAYKNGLIFGSLDATFGQIVEYINGPDDGKGSTPATESIQKNDEAAREPSLSHQSVSSMAQEEDYPDHPQSPPHVPENLPPLEDDALSGSVLKYGNSKQDLMLPLGGPQYPLVQTPPGYSFAFGQPLPGGQLVQNEGHEPQSGNSLVLSTSGSTPLMTQPAGVGQNSIAVSPQQVPVFRHPYPPNYFPYSHYFPAVYLPPTAHQFLGHGGFPLQPSTSNVYLPPPPAASGVKFSVPLSKPGIHTGSPSHFGIPFGYNSSPVGYSPSPPVTSGSSASNEDVAASELKENNMYRMAQQSEGSLVWFPPSRRDISTLQANSFYNLPQGQHVTFSPAQAGHGPFTGIYHPAQTMAAPSTAHTLL
uniref:Putative RNA polymerase II degradation factor 1 isoform X3 n=1 Tax=Davidia involucrata TaxID=16924 RepID=A0A5B7BJ76_DAVIN